MGFGSFSQLSECGHIYNGQLRQDLSIQFDPRLFKALDQLAIRDPVEFGGGADARYPETAKRSLFDPSIAVRESERALYRLVRRPIQAASASDVALGQLHYLFSSLPGFTPALSSWHCVAPFKFK
jgi:hypothetical protein